MFFLCSESEKAELNYPASLFPRCHIGSGCKSKFFSQKRKRKS